MQNRILHPLPKLCTILPFITCFILFNPTTNSFAQCIGGSNQGSLSPSPDSSTQILSIKGGRYYTFPATTNLFYLFSTHPDDGGLSLFDTKITILDSIGNPLAWNDDYCDRSSRLIWQAPYTGTFRILMMRYNCVGTGTPSDMAYKTLSEYTPIDYNCNTTACSNNEYELLLNTPPDLLDFVFAGGEPDANGMIGANQTNWEKAEFQRGGVRRMVQGVIYNDTAYINDAWITMAGTFGQQTNLGNFNDNASSVCFWLHECAHSLLILKDSPLYPQYTDSIAKYLPLMQQALEFVTDSINLDSLLNRFDKQSPNRLWVDATAIAFTALLIDDTTTYMPIARICADQAMGLLKDSIFCEKGGYDTSYQGVAMFLMNYFAMRVEYPLLDCYIRRTTLWEAARVRSDGFIDTLGNSRTSNCQEVYAGQCKQVNYREVSRSFLYYGLRFCDYSQGIDLAISTKNYSQNTPTFTPSISCLSDCQTLPLHIESTQIHCSPSNQLYIQWQSNPNIPSEQWTIEQSHTATQWKKDKTAAIIESNQGTYTYQTNTITPYYRISTQDENGQSHYSSILQAPCSPQPSLNIQFLSPSTLNISLQSPQNRPLNIRILDLHGRTLAKWTNQPPQTSLQWFTSHQQWLIIEVHDGYNTWRQKIF